MKSTLSAKDQELKRLRGLSATVNKDLMTSQSEGLGLKKLTSPKSKSKELRDLETRIQDLEIDLASATAALQEAKAESESELKEMMGALKKSESDLEKKEKEGRVLEEQMRQAMLQKKTIALTLTLRPNPNP